MDYSHDTVLVLSPLITTAVTVAVCNLCPRQRCSVSLFQFCTLRREAVFDSEPLSTRNIPSVGTSSGCREYHDVVG